MNYFHKKVAVVTGASSGIGRALAMGLAKNGCNLAIADIDSDGLKETADMIGRIGVHVILRKLDVTRPDDMRMFAGQVIETFGKTDILVNNAGITTVAMVDEMNRAVFNRVMDVNFWGVFNGISAFLPYMYMQTNAQIVNISSVFGLWGIPSQAAYNCSKFAVRALSESLAQELAGTSIIVSCVYPGGVKTNIARGADFQQSFGPLSDKETFAKFFDDLAFTTPEKAAATIIRGIKERRARILIGPDAYLMDFTQRLFPSLYQKIIPMLIRRRLT